MSDRPFAYICSPFRGDTEANAERAREYCRQVFEAGYAPIAPHTIFTQFLSEADPKEREAGMAMGMALMPLCRVLLVCGNDITEGMKAEIKRAQSLDIETCALANIPPIPTLAYRYDLSNLDNIDIAVSLIEGMSGCRFQSGSTGAFIRPDENAHLAVNMKKTLDSNAKLHRISFNANVHKLGHPMNADDLFKHQQETVRIQTLLTLLESREFVLTPKEMQIFNDSIQKREKHPAEKDSVLAEIAESRNAQGEKPKSRKTPAPGKKKSDPEH